MGSQQVDQMHEGRPPSHPWYYKLGGRILEIEEILPSSWDRPVEDIVMDCLNIKGKKEKLLGKANVKAALEVLFRRFEERGSRYERFRREGEFYDDYVFDPSRLDLMDLSLVHNHISNLKRHILILEQHLKQQQNQGLLAYC